MKLEQRIGRRIRAARIERKLTQQQLADLIGRSVETVGNIERGSYALLLKLLEVIGARLDIPLIQFMAAPETPAVDKERFDLELRLAALARALSLSDLHATIAVAETLANLRRHEPTTAPRRTRR